jgi:hypothetical protein
LPVFEADEEKKEKKPHKNTAAHLTQFPFYLAWRVRSYYLPWTCEAEKHAYEKCEYD